MKTSATIFTAILLGFATTTTISQNGSNLTLITSAPMGASTQVVFLPTGNVEVNFWDQAHAKIEIEVDGQGLSRAQLKALIPLGIFHLQTQIVGDVATMDLPNLENLIRIGSKRITPPSLSFKLTLPDYTLFERVDNQAVIAEAH